jgi:hypothetical protein
MREMLEDLPLSESDPAEAVHDWLDGAIRAAVDAKHGSPRPAAAPPAPPLDRYAANAPIRPASPRRASDYTKSSASLRRSLDPVRVPRPDSDSSDDRSSPFLRYGLIIGGAAIVAYGIAAFSPQPRGGRSLVAEAARNDAVTDAQPTSPAAPHLIVHDQQVFTNDPLPLDVAVDRSLANASLRVAGLAAGTHLSAGSPTGDSGWTVPLDGLKNLFMYAPTDFVGVMHGAVDLRGPDKKLIDRREVKLEWVERKKDPSRFSEPNATANAAPAVAVTKEASLTKDPVMTKDPAVNPVVSKDPVVSPIANPVTNPVMSPALPPIVAKDPVMSKETAESLMQRGQDSLKNGDIATARMLFSRLADAGIADAAFAAAETYDPRYLAAHNVLGVPGDDAKAREFYQRAAQLGSSEASAHLAGAVAK